MKQQPISAHLGIILSSLDGIEAEYQRLVRIQKAARDLVAARDAINDPQTISEQTYDVLSGRLSLAWENLRVALAGRKP